MSKAGVRIPPATRGNERWFLVHTRAKSEHKAEHHLQAQGFKTYLPRIRKTVRHARRMTTVEAPAFPRYLFIILDLGRDRWSSVSSTVGVSSLICCNDRPVPVPTGIVETIIRQSNDDLVRLDANLMVGEKVRVLLGPFADLVGSLERLDDAGRVRVLLELMGTVVPIATHRSALAPAA